MIPLPENILLALDNPSANYSLLFKKWVNFNVEKEGQINRTKIIVYWYKKDIKIIKIEKKVNNKKQEITEEFNDKKELNAWLKNQGNNLNDQEKASLSQLFDDVINIKNIPSLLKELGDKKIEEFIRLKTEFENRRPQLQKVAASQKNRILNMLSVLRRKGCHGSIVKAKVSDALICGLGDEHTLENSIRLDHCTGLPYIPSSSIKGVSRFGAKFDEATDKRDRKENILFGSQEGVGVVQFWDGFPVNVPKLKIDIMNNHFQDYYSDKKLYPSDDMGPNPIPFIVVDSGSEFYFPIVADSQSNLEKAIEFLKTALSDWGVGAKGSVGYGIFYDFTDEPIPLPKPKPKVLSANELAFENLRKSTNPENFTKFLLTLKEPDSGWLSSQDLFQINGFNIGFANKLFEIESIPLNIRKIFAQQFLEKIDLKKAKKRAEKKGDKTNLERYERLKEIIES